MPNSPRPTIFALSSGRGPAAIAVVRISGPRAGAALSELGVKILEPRKAGLARVRDPVTHEIIDEALALWFPSPHSETGEDTAELQLHGGHAVIAATLAALGSIEGLRPAEAGEFTRRAFENGKLDLTAVEGLADLVMAETQGQRRQAFRQMKGLLGERAEGWRQRLIQALALVEARIDFSDEADVLESAADAALAQVRALATDIAAVLSDQGRGERLRDGIVVAIAGPPNAGKSTLLNKIARREAAIVSPYAGTTRDVIEVHLDLAGLPVTLLDTAGIRETDDPVEMEGVRRACERAASADLVLWVVDASAGVDAAGEKPPGADAEVVADNLLEPDEQWRTGLASISPVPWGMEPVPAMAATVNDEVKQAAAAAASSLNLLPPFSDFGLGAPPDPAVEPSPAKPARPGHDALFPEPPSKPKAVFLERMSADAVAAGSLVALIASVGVEERLRAGGEFSASEPVSSAPASPNTGGPASGTPADIAGNAQPSHLADAAAGPAEANRTPPYPGLSGAAASVSADGAGSGEPSHSSAFAAASASENVQTPSFSDISGAAAAALARDAGPVEPSPSPVVPPASDTGDVQKPYFSVPYGPATVTSTKGAGSAEPSLSSAVPSAPAPGNGETPSFSGVSSDTEPPTWLIINKIDLVSAQRKNESRSQLAGSNELRVRSNEPLKLMVSNELTGSNESKLIMTEYKFSLSATTGEGFDELLLQLGRFAGGFLAGSESALITRERHRRALSDALAALRRALAPEVAVREDLLAEEIRAAAYSLGRLLGRVDVEDVLDVIFRDFCIGK